MQYKAIILAGGAGTRLWPLTSFTCKQLLGLYDKPVIFYPLCLALLSGVREILIISTANATPQLEEVLGNGEDLGCCISYKCQEKPNGIAEALILGEDFLDGCPCILLLGDNVLIKSGYTDWITSLMDHNKGATIFGARVDQPQDFGIVEISRSSGQVLSISEKPSHPKSNVAAIGMYLYDGTAPARAKELKPSNRGELEITDLNKSYLADDQLCCDVLSRGDFWADVGTPDNLLECSVFVKTFQHQSSRVIGSPEEAALRQGLITAKQYENLIKAMPKSPYSKILFESVNDAEQS